MGIAPRRTEYGNTNRRALITEHAVNDGLGCTLKAATWKNAPGVTDGIVPALYPVAVDADGIATPYTSGGTFSGFTINPVNTAKGDDSTGYIWHGTIDATLLPVTFDPASVTGAAASRFVFAKA